MPFRVGGAELREPAVVGPGAGHAELRVLVAGEAEADAEGGGGRAVHGVGVREDDLGCDPVAVQLLRPLRRVPTGAQPLLVVLEPLGGEGLVADAEPGHRRAPGLPAGQELVKGRWKRESR
ncbi:hypothetical protein GCM10010211_68470 [Streptomyces albospinus]|uniref:Uncharacterized protein n=1 Tax=Streptomyces albospinus TaxID=285515 RepID=A0ABQ2VM68_9ACTN|nr:hypothetical protein GCM10010211_68470 [Streptomyces albospinus]